MGKKLKNSKQPLDSSLNLKQGKSKQMKKRKNKFLEVKIALKAILYDKKIEHLMKIILRKNIQIITQKYLIPE